MENWLQTLSVASGSIGAFWIIIRYVLAKLDSKLDIAVFDEFSKRMDSSLVSGNKRFDRIELALKENNSLLTTLCSEIGELKGAIKKL